MRKVVDSLVFLVIVVFSKFIVVIGRTRICGREKFLKPKSRGNVGLFDNCWDFSKIHISNKDNYRWYIL